MLHIIRRLPPAAQRAVFAASAAGLVIGCFLLLR